MSLLRDKDLGPRNWWERVVFICVYALVDIGHWWWRMRLRLGTARSQRGDE